MYKRGSVMRYLLCIVIAALVAGCVSEEALIPSPIEGEPFQKPKETEGLELKEERVTTSKVYPVRLSLQSVSSFASHRDYLNLLLPHLSNSSIYQLKNSHELYHHYRFERSVGSSDTYKKVLSFKKRGASDWGYVTTSIGKKAVANTFLIESEQWGRQYGLVIKQMKICLVTQASDVPAWQGGRWIFAARPGRFECTGSTQRSVFKPESGYPRLLGPYYDEQYTMFVFNEPDKLTALLSMLKKQFPLLQIPH